MITGTNGKGKSALIVEAIFFALFGKSFKNIKIKSIVNDINKRNCVVDLKFKVDGKECRIVRGLLPDFVEFYKGDEQEDSRSSKKLMQKEINDVIKLNPDTLKNICILAANESKSFLDMNAKEARTVIENLFGIYVYSLMLQEVKIQKSEAKDKINNIESDITLYSEIIEDYKKNFEKAKELKINFEKEKESKLNILNDREKTIRKTIDETIILDILTLEKKISHIRESIHEVQLDIGKEASEYKISNKLKKELEEKINIINDNTICPLCSNKLTGKHKEKEIKGINIKIDNYSLKLENSLEKIDTFKKEVYQLENDKKIIETDLRVTKTKRADEIKLKHELEVVISNIKRTEEDTINKHISALIDIKKIKEYISKFKILKEEKENLKQEFIYQDTIKDVLSDEGVKRYIIKKDLPFLNSKINEYLRKLGFNLNLEFTETFDLMINNPRKKNYQYNNFSNGQKKRIDLSILLAFIDLAKRKNSINTNLLIFDEVLDSSLDAEGASDFINILNRKIKETDLNVFVISHKKDLILENCRKIEIDQDGEFSIIKKILI